MIRTEITNRGLRCFGRQSEEPGKHLFKEEIMIPESYPRFADDLHLQQERKITKRRQRSSSTALVFAVLLAMGSVVAGVRTATAQITFTEKQCETDIACKAGTAECPNDVPGQKDLTAWCAAPGAGVFELYSLWQWDQLTLTGTNTLDGCTLYDTDSTSDGLANIAVCVTVRSNGTLGATRLFTCNNTSPIKCAGGVQVPGNTCKNGTNVGKACTDAASCAPKGGIPGECVPALVNSKNTTCVLSEGSDPFTAGANYPKDRQVICQVDLNDFGSATSGDLIDACSYTSQNPFSGVADCIVTKECKSNSEYNDDNVCTTDSCSSTSGTCVYTNNTNSCGSNSDTACDNPDSCSGGVCLPNREPNTTTCGDAEGACTNQDYCDGQGGCTDNGYKPDTTLCGDAGDGVCDLQDTCSGTNGQCVDRVAQWP